MILYLIVRTVLMLLLQAVNDMLLPRSNGGVTCLHHHQVGSVSHGNQASRFERWKRHSKTPTTLAEHLTLLSRTRETI